jgi:hypothetical protein
MPKNKKAAREIGKPEMPAEHPVFNGGVIDCRLDHDFARYSSGSLRMCFEGAKVSLGGKEVGSINSCMGGGVQVLIGERSWFISCQTLWEAASRADEEYLKSV